MSEYQYYEFLALDRALTQHDIRELRKYSTRATITATRFVNHYEWGDFKGNPSTWVQKYFDLTRGHRGGRSPRLVPGVALIRTKR
jgi:hypothetical protein